MSAKRGPWQAVFELLQSLFDREAWLDLRQDAIEERLAALDGGAGAKASRKAARQQLIQAKLREGKPGTVAIKDE
jgi:hypothetical protein